MSDTPAWHSLSGDCAELIHSFDWPAHPLGPVETWPLRLQAAVETLLPAGFPTVVLWGPDLLQIYNDSYRRLIGDRHPGGFGRPNRDGWPEAWAINAPIYERVFRGETVTFEDALYPLARSGVVEDVWLTISYGPVRDDAGEIGGVLVTMFETTGRAPAERGRDESAARLVESEARFRASVTASSDVVYRMSPDWSEMRQLDGRGFLADTATVSSEWLGRYIDAEDQPVVLAAIDKAIRERSVFELEHRVKAVDGGLRWTLSRAVPIFDEAGELREWMGSAIDVTDRKLSQKALEDSETRYRTFVLASNQVLYRHSADWSEMRQLSGGGFLADTAAPDPDWFDAYIPAEDQPHVWDVIQQAIRAKSVFELEHRVRRADGGIGWTLSRSIPVLGPDGEIQSWFGAASDVTDRREAETRLRDSEERLRRFAEASSDILWIRDVETLSLDYASSAFKEIYGRPRGRSAGFDDWLDMVDPQDRRKAENAVRRVVAGERVQIDYRIVRPDGQVRWLRSTDFPFVDDDGVVRRIGGVAHDMTAEKTTAERMEVLVAELQHRTRNLLGVVSALFDQSLKTSKSLPDAQQKFHARLGALARVNGLLSRLDGSERVSFDEVLHAELNAMAGNRQGQIRLEGPGGVKLRSATVQTFALALHELATNALKHGALSNPNGALEVKWRTTRDPGKERWLHVEWREFGVPVPAEGPKPAGSGAGRVLIERALPYQLGARVEYRLGAEGLMCAISLPTSSELQPDGH
ncbi:PAS domain-containing protein [Methylopila sp. M107]|uniref:PAS domain-containing sensor histidine kinase n=1 Tax=Methylopila sp. M107 TaxID=1101190 RepID=UPI0003A54D4E|nr:PAS domain-containing protein [Methylopila sp. M107]